MVRCLKIILCTLGMQFPGSLLECSQGSKKHQTPIVPTELWWKPPGEVRSRLLDSLLLPRPHPRTDQTSLRCTASLLRVHTPPATAITSGSALHVPLSRPCEAIVASWELSLVYAAQLSFCLTAIASDVLTPRASYLFTILYEIF